jgi:hypothetical protein
VVYGKDKQRARTIKTKKEVQKKYKREKEREFGGGGEVKYVLVHDVTCSNP